MHFRPMRLSRYTYYVAAIAFVLALVASVFAKEVIGRKSKSESVAEVNPSQEMVNSALASSQSSDPNKS